MINQYPSNSELVSSLDQIFKLILHVAQMFCIVSLCYDHEFIRHIQSENLENNNALFQINFYFICFIYSQ